jgi:hypothetical protein
MSYCQSCSAPLHMPDFKGPSSIYCKYCTDASGALKSREEIRAGIAGFMKSWQPGLDDAKAYERSGHFMKAMPAWAD